MKEIWKDITGYEGRYQVSNTGKVVSLKYNPPKEIFQTTTNCGYKQVKLYCNGAKKQIGIHRLVAFAFVEGYENGLEVNHIDGNKTNNLYTNLEWVTRSQNQQHQFKMYGKEKKRNYCSYCGKEISSTAVLCTSCNGLKNRKIQRPSREQLKQDIKCGCFTKVGEKYGTSDNIIRKWCIQYELPYKSKIIRNTSESGWEKENWNDIPPKEKVAKEEYIVLMIDKKSNQVLHTFINFMDAAEYLGDKSYHNHIIDVCYKRRKSAYGYYWKKI